MAARGATSGRRGGKRRPGLTVRIWAVLRRPFRRGNRRRGGSARSSAGGKREASRVASLRAAASLLGRLLLALVLCALLGGSIYVGRFLIYHSPRFALSQVHVVGGHRLSVAAATRRAAVSLGTNVLSIDTRAVENRLLTEPWVKSVAVRRELPSTLRIEISEHEPAALVALESLYLCDRSGLVFKRALPGDGKELPVVTGVGRATYVLEPELGRSQIVAALSALEHYQQQPSRPPIGEVHIDRSVGVTLYTRQGMAIELGQPATAASQFGSGAAGAVPTVAAGDELERRLQRFDAVLRALRDAPGRPVLVFLDNRAHPDHVTVRFAPTN